MTGPMVGVVCGGCGDRPKTIHWSSGRLLCKACLDAATPAVSVWIVTGSSAGQRNWIDSAWSTRDAAEVRVAELTERWKVGEWAGSPRYSWLEVGVDVVE